MVQSFLPYCVAVGMIFGDAGLLQFTEQTLADDRVIELATSGFVQNKP